jgi:hypothetical protein
MASMGLTHVLALLLLPGTLQGEIGLHLIHLILQH